MAESFRKGRELRFTEMDADLDQFEELLLRHGVTIAPGSVIEEIRLTLTEYLGLHRGELRLDPREDRRDQWLRMLGLIDIARKILRVKDKECFSTMVPHLKLLGGGTVDPSQNAHTSTEDQGNHKMFELVIAAATMGFASNIVLESPRTSSRGNPDVLFTVDGRRWGLACKVIHSQSSATYRDRVMEGARQIDLSEAETGLVVLNVKHLFPQNLLMPFGRDTEEPYEVFESAIDAHRRIDSLRQVLVDRLGANAANIAQQFDGATVAPYICHYLQGMYFLRCDGQPRMAPFVFTHLSGIGAGSMPIIPDVHATMTMLSGALQFG